MLLPISVLLSVTRSLAVTVMLFRLIIVIRASLMDRATSKSMIITAVITSVAATGARALTVRLVDNCGRIRLTVFRGIFATRRGDSGLHKGHFRA